MKAKASKDDLFKMAMAFQVSKALFVGNELDVFSLLSKKPAAVATLARKLNLHPRPLRRLLNALVASGLLNKRDEKFSNTYHRFPLLHFYIVRPHMINQLLYLLPHILRLPRSQGFLSSQA